jgi:hypothetical protein
LQRTTKKTSSGRFGSKDKDLRREPAKITTNIKRRTSAGVMDKNTFAAG